MIGTGEIIRTDLFDIADRLKEIDCGYFIFYSYKFKRYEVHHSGQRGNTLCLVVPYKRLDSRTVDLVNRTRREHRDKLIKEFEDANKALEKANFDKVIKSAEKRTEEVFSSL